MIGCICPQEEHEDFGEAEMVQTVKILQSRVLYTILGPLYLQSYSDPDTSSRWRSGAFVFSGTTTHVRTHKDPHTRMKRLTPGVCVFPLADHCTMASAFFVTTSHGLPRSA